MAMLKKYMDMALVGKSYLSVLLSLELLEQGQEVLILDDDRMGMGDFHVERLFSLEKEYLKNWGQEKNLEPLRSIDKYLTNVSSRFVFDDMHISLGESPAHNYRELVRKMSGAFSSSDKGMGICESLEGMEEFNDIYFEYCNRLGKIAYSYKDVNAANLKTLQQKCPPALKNIYSSLEDFFQNRRYEKFWWKLKTFLYMSQGIFQKKLSLEPEPLERFHIFLCLLSPFYELDQEKIFEDLVEINLKKGGQFKRTSIREWIFHKGKPWSVGLSSYEGIIHPKKMAFIGGIPCGNLVALKPAIEHYTSLDIELEFAKSPVGFPLHERVVFSGIGNMGSTFPLWEGVFNEDKAVLKFMIFAERGRKVDFVRHRVREHLFNNLEQLAPGTSKIVKDMSMTYGREVWIDKTKKITKKSDASLVSLVDFTRLEKRNSLRGVYYFGPYKETSFGSLGMLMEINNRQQFL